MTKVSFIVIGYNIENYIERCLLSILNQTLKDIEVIVVNDGSSDKTLEKMKEIKKNDIRVSIINQTNKGANEARKSGLLLAKGEYIVFVDGDDWIEKTLSEELYPLARKYMSDIICYDYYIKYDNKSKERFIDKKYTNIQGDKYLKLVLEQKISHNLCNRFIKKSYIDKTTFNKVCGTSMGEDLAGNIVLGIYEPKVIMVDKAYYYYYQRNTSTMNKSSDKLLQIEATLNYIEKILKEFNIFQKYNKQVEFLWFKHCYLELVVGCKVRIDDVHRKIYKCWKNKNIHVGNNIYCKKYMENISMFRRCIKYGFDFNYNFGAFLLRVEHKIRGIKYSE